MDIRVLSYISNKKQPPTVLLKEKRLINRVKKLICRVKKLICRVKRLIYRVGGQDNSHGTTDGNIEGSGEF